jgi:hypothetical protein
MKAGHPGRKQRLLYRHVIGSIDPRMAGSSNGRSINRDRKAGLAPTGLRTPNHVSG